MRLSLLAVGRMKPGPLRELFDSYQKRLTHPLALREVEEKRALPSEQLKQREGELLLGALPAEARVVALDERGKALSSPDLARKLAAWRDDGNQEICFVIGGADGLAPQVRARADLVLALGSMTWPHLLVRVMLAEQLFRAQSILAGHPYHRS